MTGDHRDAHTGGAHPDRGIAEDLARLVHQLALLIGVVLALGEAARVGERVEGDLVRVLLRSRDLHLVQERMRLLEQLVDGAPAGARDGLIGTDHQPLDPSRVVKRLERHHHLHRRAVRVGDDSTVGLERLGVHLCDDERDVVLHAPARGVVDNDRSGLGKARGPLPRRRSAGGEEREVKAGDRLIAEPAHAQAAVELAPDRALRGERHDLASRKRPLAQQLEHQRAHLSGCADDRDPIAPAAHRLSVSRR